MDSTNPNTTNTPNRKTRKIRNAIIGIFAGGVLGSALLVMTNQDEGTIAEQNAASRAAIEAEKERISERMAKATEACLPIAATALQVDLNSAVDGVSDTEKLAGIMDKFSGSAGDSAANTAFDACMADLTGAASTKNVDASVAFSDGRLVVDVSLQGGN